MTILYYYYFALYTQCTLTKEVNKLFTGTFKEALDALRKASQADIKKFISFMDAHPHTVGGWLLGTAKLPTGETKIRALCYFNLNGWRVSEFEKLDDLAKDMALLLDFRVTSLPDMLDELGLSANYGNGILGFLYGEKELTKSTRKLAQRYVADKASNLMQARESLGKTYMITDISSSSVSVKVSDTSIDTVSQLARLLSEAYPYVVVLNSDDCTDEQRAAMRELVGPEKYVELSVNIAQMKSARTRNQHRQG